MKSVYRVILFLMAAVLAQWSARADRTELLWQKLPGDYAWLGGAGSNTERGIAYNPVTKHVLVVSRQAPVGIHILDAESGAEIMREDDPSTPKVLDMTDVSGGTFPVNMIGVADDGFIYAANLTTGSTTSPFKIYRWSDEDATPVVVYSGDPSEGVAGAVRFGDTFNVSGGGTITRLMAGSRNTSHVAIFTPDTGEQFKSTLVAGAGASGGNLGVAFGAGDTGWSKLNSSNPLRHFSYGLGAKTATLIESVALTPASLGPIGTDPAGKYLGIMSASDAPALARVYDVSFGGALLIGEQAFGSSNANANGVGGVDIGDNKAFFVNPNNGILALKIIVEVTPVSVATQPANTTVIETGPVTLTVSALGTPPLTYQWMHAGTNIPGATSAALTLTNTSTNDAGEYTVTVSNSAGPVTSNPATLTVTPLVRGDQLTLKWKILPSERSWISDDNNTRGIAINKRTGNVLVVTRTGLRPDEKAQIRILDGATGADKGELYSNSGAATGGTFTLNMIGVADDGAIYAANLTTDSSSSPFIVYRWADETTNGPVEVVYSGDPSNGAGDIRFGDSFDVRGSGENTQILVGSRNGNNAAIIFPNPDPSLWSATAVSVPDAPNGAFGLSVAFGEGNSFYGDSGSAATRLITYDDPSVGGVITGTIARTFTSGEIPTAMDAISFDPASKMLAGFALENPDNVRLYQIPDDVTAAPSLLDQEVFPVDKSNINGTGSADFGTNTLAVLDTNNGIMMFDFTPGSVSTPTAADLSAPTIAANGNVTVTISGSVGATYTVQAANNLNGPITWTDVGPVTIGAGGTATITDTAASGQTIQFYRAVSTPTP